MVQASGIGPGCVYVVDEAGWTNGLTRDEGRDEMPFNRNSCDAHAIGGVRNSL